MFKKIILPILLLISILLGACGAKASPETSMAPATPTITSIPDPCSPENLPGEVKQIHDLTREFDDYSTLASNVPQAQLILIIPDLQRVLRDAEDQQSPVCLKTLKKLQLEHMQAVIQTLLAFVGASDESKAEQINAGIILALGLHAQYDLERATLLGITPEVVPTPALAIDTPDANAGITATNASDTDVNLRKSPDAGSPPAGILGPQVTTTVFGKTANGKWIQVEVPGQPGEKAWVYAQLVSISVPLSQVPIITP
jgi:hypothetical protein